METFLKEHAFMFLDADPLLAINQTNFGFEYTL